MRISRRSFLATAGGAVAAAASACGGVPGGAAPSGAGGATTASASAVAPTGPLTSSSVAPSGSVTPSGSAAPTASQPGASAPLPTYAPFAGVTPDLPAGEHQVPPGFLRYPASPPKFLTKPLGNGGKVTAMLHMDYPQTQLSGNRWWQALNKAVDVDLSVVGAPTADYTDKFMVVVASAQEMDIMQMAPVADLPNMLAARFADLSEHLSGDHVANHPSLAAIPSDAWATTVVNGRIWGVPQVRPAAAIVPHARGARLSAVGAAGQSPSSGREFVDLCRELSDPQQHRYAVGDNPDTTVLSAVLEMMGAPNGWQLDAGKLTSVAETGHMKDALSQVAQLWKLGCIHPDAFSGLDSDNYGWWASGVTAIYFGSIAPTAARGLPAADTELMVLPKWDGGGPAPIFRTPNGGASFIALKKASASRIEEILRILDYLAAPFGTQEYLLANWGIAGWDYTRRGSDPAPTKTGKSEWPSLFAQCGTSTEACVYYPGMPDLARAEHAFLTQALPTAIADPTWGIYAPPASNGDRTLSTTRQAVIRGQKPVTAWDGAVAAWRKAGGDAQRAAYEQALG